MGRQNVYRTLSVASVMPTQTIEDLIDFLALNRNYLFSSERRVEAFKTRTPSHSLMSDMVHRMAVLGKDQAYGLIKIPTKTVSLREAIDMTFVPIDLCQMKEMVPSSTKTLSLLPELDNKLIINVTDITKANGDFSDVTQFHYRVIRDFLSRSFYVSGGNVWLSPTLVRYVAKVYSMTIGGQIARLFNLQYGVQSFIQSVFCAFYVGKMTTTEIAPAFLKAHNKALGLPDATDLNQILSFIEDTLGKVVPETLEEVCKVIDAYDHEPLKGQHGSRLTRPVLNHKFASLAPEGQIMTIALEYPPYFLYLIMLVLSNIRIGLSFSMKNLNLLKEGQDIFDQQMRSSMFFESL